MKPSRKEKKTAKPPTPRKTRLAHHFIAKLPPPGPATGEKVRRRSLKAGDTQWEITARPDAEYDYFDIGIREPNGDVLLIGQTWNEDDAKLLIAAGAALGAARNSDKGEIEGLLIISERLVRLRISVSIWLMRSCIWMLTTLGTRLAGTACGMMRITA